VTSSHTNSESQMDAETLEALRGSIAKWEGIVAGSVDDEGSNNCPLCEMFYRGCGWPSCFGCPVWKKTGLRNCEGSPYEKWVELTDERPDGQPRKVTNEEQRSAAEAELAFLRSLLPEARSDEKDVAP
jgi:hypothetical protein